MVAGAARTILWIACVCLLIPRGAAAGDRLLVADFDGDGMHDRATLIAREAAPSVQVWLSTTHSITLLRVPAPVLRIAAADLDGDRRDELIAGGDSTRIFVWTVRQRTFERVKPRRAPFLGLSGRTGHSVDDRHDRVPPAVPAPSAQRAALTDAARPRAPAITTVPILPEDVHGESRSLPLLFGPRPPPSFR